METLLTVILVLTSLFMIVAILLQSGKGTGLAAGFGGASAGTQVFGGSGAGGFLIKVTIVLGAVFMGVSLWLAYISSQPKSALSGVESTVSGEEGGVQEEQIVTRGSGPVDAPSDEDEAADEGDAPMINLESATPEGEEAAEDAPGAAEELLQQQEDEAEPAAEQPAVDTPAEAEEAEEAGAGEEAEEIEEPAAG